MAVKATLDLRAAMARIGKITKGAAERAARLEPVLRKRAALLDGLIQRGFRQSKGPDGRPWKPLAASTIDRRRQGSARPLVDTGQLRQGVNVSVAGDAIRFGVSGAPQRYAPVHQFGTSRAGRGNSTRIPRRPFLPIDEGGAADFSSGPARKWLDDTKDAIVAYVLRGEL